MLSGIRQLLFDPFHDLPEGGSVEGVSIPAGPHDLIPSQQHTNTQKETFIGLQLLQPPFFFEVYIVLWSQFHLKSSTMF